MNFLVCQTEEELARLADAKGERARRVKCKYDAAAKIKALLDSGNVASDSFVNSVVADCMEEMDYSPNELRAFAFGQTKQAVLKLAMRHETTEGNVRAVYTSGDRIANIFTTTDKDFLREKLTVSRKKELAYGKIVEQCKERLQEVDADVNVEQLILDIDREATA